MSIFGGGGMSKEQEESIAASKRRTQGDLESAGRSQQRAERGSSRAGSRGLLIGALTRRLASSVGN